MMCYNLLDTVKTVNNSDGVKDEKISQSAALSCYFAVVILLHFLRSGI